MEKFKTQSILHNVGKDEGKAEKHRGLVSRAAQTIKQKYNIPVKNSM